MAISGKCSPVGGVLVTGSAPLTFTPGALGSQVASNVRFLWDFDNDGNWDEAVEDITPYVLAAQTMTGRDSPSNLTGKSGPGKLKLTLNNNDDRFSYFNTSSPLNTDPFSLKTGRYVRVRTTDGALGAGTITYVGVGAVAVGNNASVVPALPTGLQAADRSIGQNADLVLCLAAIRNSGTGTVNIPTGWSAVPDQAGNPMVSGNVALLGRYYQAGDLAPTITFAGGVANATTQAVCFAFRDTHQTLSEVVHNSTLQLNASAGGINVATGDLDITVDGCAVVALGWKQDDWTSAAQLSGQGLTEIVDSPTTTGDDAGICIDYKIETTAADFLATFFTITGGVSAISRSMAFALLPAVDQADPALLIRDRFERQGSSILGVDELGTPWTVRSGGGFGVHEGVATVLTGPYGYFAQTIISTIDTGSTDHYVQASIPHIVQDGRVGLIARYLDANNYVRCYYSAAGRAFVLEEIEAGVATSLTSGWLVEPWEGMTIGLGVENQRVTIYLGGCPLDSYDLSRNIAGTEVGAYGEWNTWSDLPPAVDDFYAWNRPAREVDGVIWTGKVKQVRTSVVAGKLKVVEVDCEGILADAAVTDVPAPRITRIPHESPLGPTHSVPAGAIVGDIMARAGCLLPPHPLEGNDVSLLGAHAVDDGKALELARHVETAELGFIRETNEGQVAFEDRTYRDGISSTAWFSDTPGTGQFPYSEITPFDHQAEIINRATARVAPLCPTVVDVGTQSGDSASIDVGFVCPSVETGQLVLVFVMCSGDQAGSEFGCPPPWKQHRQDLTQQEGNGVRIYSLVAEGWESGETFYFYKSTVAGTFTLQYYIIDDWYGTDDGLKMSRISTGQNSYPLSPGWSRAPALFIVFQGIIGVSSGIGWGALNSPPPVGYNYTSLNGLVVITGDVTKITGVESVYKTDVTDTEQPRPWLDVFANWLVLETLVFAVRGFNGPLSKPTIDSPKATGGEGLYVQLDDTDSQWDHHFIRTNPDVPELLYTAGDAQGWCESVLDTHSEDRPIITISWWASKSAALRRLAMRLRVSQKVTVTATGNAGLGINGDFYVESIVHQWSQGSTLWKCTTELSPV